MSDAVNTPPLLEGQVHLWQIDLNLPDEQWQPLCALLSDDEQARADRFHFEKHKRRYAVGRAWLRKLIGAYVGVAPETIEFVYNDHGKPALAGNSPVRFNVSNTSEVMLCAVVLDAEIGVDIEGIKETTDFMGIGQRWFSALETQTLSALDEREQQGAFFRAWSRKEAYIKARGEGLSHPLARFSVSMGTGDARLIEHKDEPGEVERWWMADIEVSEAFAGALVVEGRGFEVLRLNAGGLI